MNFWHELTVVSSKLLEQTGIPRRVLSRLLACTGIGVGYSVLDVGCGRGELVAFFDSLGIRCVGIDESPHNVWEARRNVPECEIHCAAVGDPLPGMQTEFDLVLVREASAFRTTLLSRPAFSATAHLVTRLRSGGSLAFLNRASAQRSPSVSHQLSCYARHVALLPGQHEFHQVSESAILGSRVRSLVTGRENGSYGIAILQVHERPLPRGEWARAIDVAAQPEHAPCCPFAAQAVEAVSTRSQAA